MPCSNHRAAEPLCCAACGGHWHTGALLCGVPRVRAGGAADELRALPHEVVLQQGLPEGALEAGPQAVLCPGEPSLSIIVITRKATQGLGP